MLEVFHVLSIENYHHYKMPWTLFILFFLFCFTPRTHALICLAWDARTAIGEETSTERKKNSWPKGTGIVPQYFFLVTKLWAKFGIGTEPPARGRYCRQGSVLRGRLNGVFGVSRSFCGGNSFWWLHRHIPWLFIYWSPIAYRRHTRTCA